MTFLGHSVHKLYVILIIIIIIYTPLYRHKVVAPEAVCYGSIDPIPRHWMRTGCRGNSWRLVGAHPPRRSLYHTQMMRWAKLQRLNADGRPTAMRRRGRQMDTRVTVRRWWNERLRGWEMKRRSSSIISPPTPRSLSLIIVVYIVVVAK